MAGRPTAASTPLTSADTEGIGTLAELAAALVRLRRREARRRGGAEYTYRELAERTGWSHAAIAEYLTGKTLPPVDRFDSLIQVLGASAAEQGLLATARDRVEDHRRAAPTGGERSRRTAPPAEPAEDRIPPPRQLPADVPGFTGREEQLARLDALLDGGRLARTAVISAISGTAGVGKTALAVHWARRVADRFPGGQLYLNLRGFDPTGEAVDPAGAIRGFLTALAVPPERIPADLQAQTGLYRSLLADKRILVVLDNAGDADQVRPLLPGAPGCLVLITSRRAMLSLVAADGAEPLRIGLLPAAQARRLLVRRLGPQRVAAEPRAVERIVARCAGLPLALTVVAARAATHPEFTLGALADQLEPDSPPAGAGREPAVGLGGFEGFDGGDPTTDIRSVFSWSYRTLGTGAARLFRLLGLASGADIGVDAAAALAGVPVGTTRTLLTELAVAHLVDEVATGRYGLHDLLRRYAGEQAGAVDDATERHAALGRLYRHYTGLVEVAAALLYPDKLRLPAGSGAGTGACAGADRDAADRDPPLWIGDRDAARSWLETERANLVAAVSHAAALGWYRVGYRLADALRAHLEVRRYTADWRGVATTALSCAETAGDHTAQAAAQLSLAVLHTNQGRHDQAIDCYRRMLTLATAGGWLDGQAAALGNLGVAYQEIGRLEEAAEHYGRALAINELTGWLPGRANGLSNLGDVLHALGRFDQALAAITEARMLRELTGDRHGEADTVRALAAVHRDAGRLRDALRLAGTALGLARDTGDHRYEAEALSTLGTVRLACGDHAGAVHLQLRAVDLARDIGSRHTEAEALIGLAAGYQRAGAGEDALVAAARALELARAGGLRVLQAHALAALAIIHLERGAAHQAAVAAEQARSVYAEAGHRLGEARVRVIAERALATAPIRTTNGRPG